MPKPAPFATVTAADFRRAEKEDPMQRRVVIWCKSVAARYDERARSIYAIPNGQYRPGQRKEAGMEEGMPDLHLPVIVEGRGTLYVEMKTATGKLRDAQIRKAEELRALGHTVIEARTVRRACEAINEHLGIDAPAID